MTPERCPALFMLRQKGIARDKPSQCVKTAGHPGAHKSVKPGGMVNWKERKREGQ